MYITKNINVLDDGSISISADVITINGELVMKEGN